MFNKITLYLIAICALSGCASNKINQTGIDAVQRGEKAVVVLTCNAVVQARDLYNLSKRPHDFECNTVWNNLASTEEITQVGGGLYDKKVYLINPGTYSLSSVVVPEAAGYMYSVHDLKNIAQFEVKGGEVLYLGEITFNINQSAIIARMVDIKDKYSSAGILMQKANPILAGNLQKRLIKLSKLVEAVKSTNLIMNAVPSSQK